MKINATALNIILYLVLSLVEIVASVWTLYLKILFILNNYRITMHTYNVYKCYLTEQLSKLEVIFYTSETASFDWRKRCRRGVRYFNRTVETNFQNLDYDGYEYWGKFWGSTCLHNLELKNLTLPKESPVFFFLFFFHAYHVLVFKSVRKPKF